MPRTLQLKRFANTVVANTVGAAGELIIDNTNYILTIHDGVTPGGHTVTANNNVVSSAIDQYARNTANAITSAAFLSTGGTITGNVSITGSEFVTNNVVSNNSIVYNTFYTGLATGSQTVLPNLLAQFTGNNANYVQVNAQNINQLGSGDYVVTADVGNDTNYYIDMGVQGSQNYDAVNASAFFPLDGYLYVQGSTINQTSGNLILGTTGTFPGLRTVILAGGSNTNNIVVTVNTAGMNVIGSLNVTGTISGQTINYMTGVNASQNNSINALGSAGVLPQNPQSASYVLANTDAGKHLYYTNGSIANLYLPWSSNAGFSNGTTMTVVSHTSSNVMITPNTGVSLYLAGNTTSTTRNVTTYGVATLLMTAANTWYVYGTGVV
jgi:hypothetical protein